MSSPSQDLPSICEQEEVEPPEDCVESKLGSSELLRDLVAVGAHLALLLSAIPSNGLKCSVDRRRMAALVDLGG